MTISRRLTIAVFNALHEFKKQLHTEYFTVMQVAAKIGVSHPTVKKYGVEQGTLTKIGGVYRIHCNDLEKLNNYINERINRS